MTCYGGNVSMRVSVTPQSAIWYFSVGKTERLDFIIVMACGDWFAMSRRVSAGHIGYKKIYVWWKSWRVFPVLQVRGLLTLTQESALVCSSICSYIQAKTHVHETVFVTAGRTPREMKAFSWFLGSKENLPKQQSIWVISSLCKSSHETPTCCAMAEEEAVSLSAHLRLAPLHHTPGSSSSASSRLRLLASCSPSHDHCGGQWHVSF